jgi:hypothetical protein
MYSPSEDSEDDSDDGGLDRTYSGDDDAFQTDEVVQVQLLEETRRAAEEYLQAVGFERAAASRLALQLDKPVSVDSIPEVCSDLIDKHGGGASPRRAGGRGRGAQHGTARGWAAGAEP